MIAVEVGQTWRRTRGRWQGAQVMILAEVPTNHPDRWWLVESLTDAQGARYEFSESRLRGDYVVVDDEVVA